MRFRAILVAVVLLFDYSLHAADSAFKNFITARGDQLFDGDQPFRFISFNIPNYLGIIEDDMRFDQLNPFRVTTPYEMDDAMATIQQMGGQVARTYVLTIKKTNDASNVPRHILALDKFDETCMVAMDQALATANRRCVRLIIPFIDFASWMGGITEFASWRDKAKNDFFTDPQVKADYKRLVEEVLNRTNTITGVQYKNDKAVLAWELGNELRAPTEWVAEMAPYIKQLDPKHLVAESYFTDPNNPGVDIVQDHLYQGDPVKMIDQIHTSLKRAAGKKVYMVGEFGFITTEGMRAIIDTVIKEPAVSGALIWSLRFHNQDGGYYWHHEPWGGDFFKAYHWPGGPEGEPYDETRFMRMVREKAYEIQNLPVPPLHPPDAPDLFSVTDGGILTWRGSTGAANYDLQRAEKARGPWQTINWQLTDDAAQYHPLAVDETALPGHTYYYRLIAHNEAGVSKPSKAFGPVTMRCRTLVDELENLSLTYRKGGKVEFRSNDARNVKEDRHRLRGVPGDWISYHVSGRITAVRVYAFGALQEEPGLEFRIGDGGNGQVIQSITQDYFAGKELYNYHWPRLYKVGALPDNGQGISILFQKETQLSRIEIEYHEFPSIRLCKR